MSKRSDGLLADELAHRWAVTSAPAAGATVVASVSAAQAHEKLTLDCLSYTIKNMSAAAFTVTTSVRDASVAGTVLASWDEIIGVAVTGGKHLEGLGISTAKGNSLFFTQDTVLASVKATVNATGWRGTTQDY